MLDTRHASDDAPTRTQTTASAHKARLDGEAIPPSLSTSGGDENAASEQRDGDGRSRPDERSPGRCTTLSDLSRLDKRPLCQVTGTQSRSALARF